MKTSEYLNSLTVEQKKKIVENFLNLKDIQQLAALLNIQYRYLIYYLYKIPADKKYQTFNILKKSGGYREINAPDNLLRLIQRRLNDILQLIYRPKISANGFILGRSIVTNAKRHVNKNNVLNIDLKDFFPSINFGRVRGMFINQPFNFPETFATALAHLCCFNKALPQGAPTSPVISNIICRSLDTKLIEFAKNNYCSYTRYADDITFSTNKKDIPVLFLDTIKTIITEEGFVVNENKIRYQKYMNRQEVTGLVVNEKINVKRNYIRNIRAILYDWEKNGYKEAQLKYFNKYDRHRFNGVTDLVWSVKGKINFIGSIRGKDDIIYSKLMSKYKLLYDRDHKN